MKKLVGTLSTVVGQILPPFPQIDVGLQSPTLNGGEWGGNNMKEWSLLPVKNDTLTFRSTISDTRYNSIRVPTILFVDLI